MEREQKEKRMQPEFSQRELNLCSHSSNYKFGCSANELVTGDS